MDVQIRRPVREGRAKALGEDLLDARIEGLDPD